jgi:hypothetical protein
VEKFSAACILGQAFHMGMEKVVACCEESAQQWRSHGVGSSVCSRRGTAPTALGWQLGGLGLFRRRLLVRVDEEQVDELILG